MMRGGVALGCHWFRHMFCPMLQTEAVHKRREQHKAET